MASSRELIRIDYLELMSGEAGYHRCVEKICEGLERDGFIAFVNHGLTPDLWQQVQAVVREFFSLRLAVKLKYARPDLGFQRGYGFYGCESAEGQPPHLMDLKEIWMMRWPEIPDNANINMPFGDNIWPDEREVPGFQRCMTAYTQVMLDVARVVIQAISMHYRLPRGWLMQQHVGAETMTRPILYRHPDAYLNQARDLLYGVDYPLIPDHIRFALEAILEQPELIQQAVPSAGHLDINFLTALPYAVGRKSAGRGLWVRDQTTGEKVAVGTEPGVIIVDVGEMAAQVHGLESLTPMEHGVHPPTQDYADWDKSWDRVTAPVFVHLRHDTNLRWRTPQNPLYVGPWLYRRLVELGAMPTGTLHPLECH